MSYKLLFNNIIISRVQMGFESIAHEAERNNNFVFSKIQLVG